jgi:hypothetical protein
MFHCLLNDDEREVFVKVFHEGDNWKNLYSLAKKIPGRLGGLVSVTSKTGNKLFTSKVSPRPDWKDFILAIVENRFDLEKETGSDTLVSGPTKAIPLKASGVIVELRRMGFGVLSSASWLGMSTRLFDKARSLTA